MNNSWKYIKNNISENDLDNFEQLTGINFANDLRHFFLKHNNGRPTLNQFDTNESKGEIFDKLLSFNKSDKENVFSTYETASGEIPNNLIVIGIDPFGNYICLDKSNNLNVVLWLHEISSARSLNKNFINFIEELY